jgi:hypothetical protein
LLHIFTNSRRAPRGTARRGSLFAEKGTGKKWSKEGRKFPAAGQEDEQGEHWKNFWASMGERALRRAAARPWKKNGRGGLAPWPAKRHEKRSSAPCVEQRAGEKGALRRREKRSRGRAELLLDHTPLEPRRKGAMVICCC